MSRGKYITILEWMLGLNLRPSELIVFALIYGFSQDGRSKFKGSVEYICHWTGLTPRSVQTILKNMTEAGLIEKTVCTEDARFVDYGCKNFIESMQKFHRLYEKTSPKIYEKTSYHNNTIDINIDNNKIIPPYNSPTFVEIWDMLLRQPKWRKKSEDALRMSAEELGKVTEEVAIQMMRNSIKNGWQGLFPLDKPAKQVTRKPKYNNPTDAMLDTLRQMQQPQVPNIDEQ